MMVVGIIALIIIGLSIIILARLTKTTKDIKKIKQRIEKVQQRDLSKIDQEIVELLGNGKKILAIKRVREHFGLGLKEAKEYVDSLENRFFG